MRHLLLTTSPFCCESGRTLIDVRLGGRFLAGPLSEATSPPSCSEEHLFLVGKLVGSPRFTMKMTSQGFYLTVLSIDSGLE